MRGHITRGLIEFERIGALFMPTPAAITPPTPGNVHLYMAAALAWKKTWRDELRRHNGNHKLAYPMRLSMPPRLPLLLEASTS
jgi:hypothetical protein